MQDWVPRGREHHSREYLSRHLCPFPCHNIILPLPRNALERSSAKTLGLITEYFPWIKSSGSIHQDSPKIVLSNSRFINFVRAERFMIKWRKRLEFVSHEFDLKRFWVHMSSSTYLCCCCGILELYSNLIPRSIQVSLVGTRLVHLWHMEFAPMMHLSFSLTAVPFLHSVMLCLIA